MGACLATPHDDAADVFKAPGVDSGPLDSVERRDDPAIGVAVASRLKLRAVAAAKEARGVRFRYNGGVIDGTDAGVVELAISRVKIDDTRAVTAALDANEPLLVTLFHRRGEDRKSASDEDGDEEDAPNARQSNNRERRVHARWVAVGVAECFPDGAKSGALLTHFRERARRELSRHKAPVFALPSDLRFCEGTRDKTLRVVVAKKKNLAKRRFSEDAEDVSNSNPRASLESNHSGSPEGSPTNSFDLAEIDRGTYLTTPPTKTRSKKPPTRSRSPPTVLGSATFSFADVLSDDRRASRQTLITHDRLVGFGTVPSRSGEILVTVTPASISREWKHVSNVRAKTPPGLLSFESALAAFAAAATRDKQKRAAPETSWALGARDAKVSREDARLEARDEARATRNARGRTYASADGRAARTRGGGSRRRDEDPGFDDENLFEKHVPVAGFARGGLGGNARGY